MVEKHVEVVEEEEEKEDELDHRMAVLEEKIIALEKKKNPVALYFSVIIFAVVVAFYVAIAWEMNYNNHDREWYVVGSSYVLKYAILASYGSCNLNGTGVIISVCWTYVLSM